MATVGVPAPMAEDENFTMIELLGLYIHTYRSIKITNKAIFYLCAIIFDAKINTKKKSMFGL